MKNVDSLVSEAADLTDSGLPRGEIADELNVSRETSSGLIERVTTDALDVAVEMADVIKATPDEPARLGYQQESLGQRCEAICRDGPHTVFLTCGDEGATAYATKGAPWDGGVVEHGGFDVDVVDTTGAGDAFVAATVAALARGTADLDRIVELANASVALSATTTGAMEQPSGWGTIREFVADLEQ
jgi:fructokinase